MFTPNNLPNSVQSRSLFGGRYDTKNEQVERDIEQLKNRNDVAETKREIAMYSVKEEHAEGLNDLKTRFIDLLKEADHKTKNDLDPGQVWCPQTAFLAEDGAGESENNRGFETFVSGFLSFMVNWKEWRRKYLDDRISEITTTVVDKAYGCLLGP